MKLVLQIALGVLIGNVAFGVLSWLVMTVAVERAQTEAAIEQANASYAAMQSGSIADHEANAAMYEAAADNITNAMNDEMR